MRSLSKPGIFNTFALLGLKNSFFVLKNKVLTCDRVFSLRKLLPEETPGIYDVKLYAKQYSLGILEEKRRFSARR